MKNAHQKSRGAGMILLALGVVFGDIGTSPIYAYQTALGVVGPDHALGVASLILWTLFLVVAVKYVLLVLRADYHGEGGVFALMALLFKGRPGKGQGRCFMACLLVFGAALLFGDGAITPAISVLSAVEGLAAVNPAWSHYPLPLALIILLGLFFCQRFGTGHLGKIFGPLMLVWFLVLAAMGVAQIFAHPPVLAALNPLLAASILTQSGWEAWFLVGAVVLAVTGAEALYADLAHFGRIPIARAWKAVVFPALLLNYLGQAAFAAQNPELAMEGNLFFLLVPGEHLRTGLVVLATCATIIASQALISGAFSLASQAMDLGYLPRLYVRHTNAKFRGQIYIPVVNALLGTLCVLLVLTFRTSEALAGAYGVAVTGAMAITSIAFVLVLVKTQGLAAWKGGILLASLLCLDLPLFGACLTKLADGGAVPLLLAASVAAVLLTWKKGRSLVRLSLLANTVPPEKLAVRMEQERFARIPGLVAFVVRRLDPEYAVARILEQYRRTGVLPRHLVILQLNPNWQFAFAEATNIRVSAKGGGLWVVEADHGYMVEPDAPAILHCAVREAGLAVEPEKAFYSVAQEIILTCTRKQMRNWEKALFGFLARNVLPGPDYLRIPPDRLIVYTWLLRLSPDAREPKSGEGPVESMH